MPGRTRSLLPRVEVRAAGKLSRCHHDKRHEIQKGETRVVVRNPGPAAGEYGYCIDCALAMLRLARHQIDELESALT